MQSEVIPNVLETLARVMDNLGKSDLSDTNIIGAAAGLRNLADYLTDSLQANDDAPAEGEWVSVKVPILDGRGGTIHQFDVLAAPDATDTQLLGMGMFNAEMAASAAMVVLRGWRHVLDGNGKEIPFGRDNLAELFACWPLLGSRIAKAIKQNREIPVYG